MRKTSKLLCLVVVAVFAFSLVLTGCGSSSSSTSANTSTTPAATVAPSASTAAATDASKLDPVDLKWYVIGNGQQPDVQSVLDEANKYLKEKLNATLSLTCFLWGDDYEKKMTAKVASGEEFDICFTANWALNYGQNAAKGAFVDITDLIGKYAPKTKAVLGDAIIKGASINGKLYAIPTKK